MPPIAIPAIAPLPIPDLDLRFRAGLGREVRVERGGLIVVVVSKDENTIAVVGVVSRPMMRLSTTIVCPTVIVTSG